MPSQATEPRFASRSRCPGRDGQYAVIDCWNDEPPVAYLGRMIQCTPVGFALRSRRMIKPPVTADRRYA
jgi:hypothetical protein